VPGWVSGWEAYCCRSGLGWTDVVPFGSGERRPPDGADIGRPGAVATKVAGAGVSASQKLSSVAVSGAAAVAIREPSEGCGWRG